MRSHFMQYFARGSFLGGFFPPKTPSCGRHFAFKYLLEPCERRRSEGSSLRLSRLSLYDEEDLLLWRRIANGFDFRHTGGAEGVKTHTVLRIDEIFAQLCLQEDHILSREKTLE